MADEEEFGSGQESEAWGDDDLEFRGDQKDVWMEEEEEPKAKEPEPKRRRVKEEEGMVQLARNLQTSFSDQWGDLPAQALAKCLPFISVHEGLRVSHVSSKWAHSLGSRAIKAMLKPASVSSSVSGLPTKMLLASGIPRRKPSINVFNFDRSTAIAIGRTSGNFEGFLTHFRRFLAPAIQEGESLSLHLMHCSSWSSIIQKHPELIQFLTTGNTRHRLRVSGVVRPDDLSAFANWNLKTLVLTTQPSTTDAFVWSRDVLKKKRSQWNDLRLQPLSFDGTAAQQMLMVAGANLVRLELSVNQGAARLLVNVPTLCKKLLRLDLRIQGKWQTADWKVASTMRTSSIGRLALVFDSPQEWHTESICKLLRDARGQDGFRTFHVLMPGLAAESKSNESRLVGEAVASGHCRRLIDLQLSLPFAFDWAQWPNTDLPQLRTLRLSEFACLHAKPSLRGLTALLELPVAPPVWTPTWLNDVQRAFTEKSVPRQLPGAAQPTTLEFGRLERIVVHQLEDWAISEQQWIDFVTFHPALVHVHLRMRDPSKTVEWSSKWLGVGRLQYLSMPFVRVRIRSVEELPLATWQQAATPVHWTIVSRQEYTGKIESTPPRLAYLDVALHGGIERLLDQFPDMPVPALVECCIRRGVWTPKELLAASDTVMMGWDTTTFLNCVLNAGITTETKGWDEFWREQSHYVSDDLEDACCREDNVPLYQAFVQMKRLKHQAALESKMQDIGGSELVHRLAHARSIFKLMNKILQQQARRMARMLYDAQDAGVWLDVMFNLAKETFAYEAWMAWRDDVLALLPQAKLPKYPSDSFYLAGNILRDLEVTDDWLQIVLQTQHVRQAVQQIMDHGVDAYVKACLERNEQLAKYVEDKQPDGSVRRVALAQEPLHSDPITLSDAYQFSPQAIATIVYPSGVCALFTPATWAGSELKSDPFRIATDEKEWATLSRQAFTQASVRLGTVHPSTLPDDVGIEEYLGARNINKLFFQRLPAEPPKSPDADKPFYLLNQLLQPKGVPLDRLKEQLQRERIDKAGRSIEALSLIHYLLTHRAGEFKQDETLVLNHFPTEDSFGPLLILESVYAQLLPVVQADPDVYAVDVANGILEWLSAARNAESLNAKLSAVDGKTANADQKAIGIVGPTIPEGALDRRVRRERPSEDRVQTSDAESLIDHLLYDPDGHYGTRALYATVVGIEGKEAQQRQLFGQPSLEAVYGFVARHIDSIDTEAAQASVLAATVRAFYRWLATFTNYARDLNEVLATLEAGEAVTEEKVLGGAAEKGLGQRISIGTLEGLVDREFVFPETQTSNEASTLVHDIVSQGDLELTERDLEPYTTLEPLFGRLLRHLRDSPDADTRANRLMRLVQAFYTWLNRFEV